MRNHSPCGSLYLLQVSQKPIKWEYDAIHEEIRQQYALDIFVRTVFSVTTENFIGAIKDAPPPIEIPWTSATCTVHKMEDAEEFSEPMHAHFYFNIRISEERINSAPWFFYMCGCDCKANTFDKQLRGRNPLWSTSSKCKSAKDNSIV